LKPKLEIRNGTGVMLNLVQHLVLFKGQILKSEILILKQVQDDTFRKFQIFLPRIWNLFRI